MEMMIPIVDPAGLVIGFSIARTARSMIDAAKPVARAVASNLISVSFEEGTNTADTPVRAANTSEK
jgi:hypothetical protein